MPSQLHGDAEAAAAKAGVKGVEVSISHDDTQAIAIALSKF
jgi:fatty acid synthase subunit alpha, fungi type